MELKQVPTGTASAPKSWTFFRAGGVVQVDLKTAQDLEYLDELDRKHWMALAIPVQGVSLDLRTMQTLDSDGDGQIRPPELIQTISWLKDRLQSLEILMAPKGELALDQIKDPKLLVCAQRILRDINTQLAAGSPLLPSSNATITLAQVDLAIATLSHAPLNGDGVIVAESTDDPEVAHLLGRMITSYGSVTDRSGKPGASLEVVSQFFTALDERRKWLLEGAGYLEGLQKEVFGATEQGLPVQWTTLDGFGQVYAAFNSVEKAVDDYFVLSQLKSYDQSLYDRWMDHPPEGGDIRGILANRPLALPIGGGPLDLAAPVNPRYLAEMAAFKDLCGPLLSHSAKGLEREGNAELRPADWQRIKLIFRPYELWLAQRPENGTANFSDQECHTIALSQFKQKISQIIAEDQAKSADYQGVVDLQKLLLLNRDLLRVLQNFVNFADFYRSRNGIFQIGTLFLDGRSTTLCMDMINAPRHSTLDVLSGAFLIYCDCTRAGAATRSILAVMTNGDGAQIIAGRAGIFYDRQGQDWSAIITKVVANPVSYREAFWSPYRRIVRWVEEQISKRMALADITSPAELDKVVTTSLPVPPPPVPPAAPAKKIDVGTVAAMGVALGSLGTFAGLIVGKFFGLGLLMPFGVAGICLIISGPSMVLAWFKLKNRNLGPILDANGWAINTRAIINVPFAASLTALRQVPMSFGAVLPDPYAEKSRPWKFYWTLAVLLFVGALWITGHLDRFLPQSIRYSHIIQQSADLATPPLKP